jgi:hypothetical protein
MQIHAVGFNQGRLYLEVEGYPTEILEKAHALAASILGQSGNNRPWHFTMIEFQPPKDEYYGNKWLGLFRAEVKKR